MERAVLKLWEGLDAFAESNRRRESAEPFVFYDGPPFATGTPHYGHLLAGTIKDIIPRYWNMRGHPVERRFGWDCHGLPIEALAQDALGLSGAGEIADHGIAAFNEQCRSMVQRYVSEWRTVVTRMGRWVDFDDDYKTMDLEYMESVWWVFRQLWDQGRVYRSHRIMPYSWKLTTPLSNFEANSNYKDVQDPAITVSMRFVETPGLEVTGEVCALAWTTTPWTLPANLAMCVGGELEYSVCRVAGQEELLLVAAARVEAVLGEGALVLQTLRGSELVGWRYEPLFPYFEEAQGAFVVLADDFVSTEEGTGIVHMAPAFGEDDYRICVREGIALVDPLDAEARFTRAAPDFDGMHCKEADKAIIRALKERGRLFAQATVMHSYPFCERTETPLIYRAIDAWYVRVEDMREELVANNDAIHWIPEAVGQARFGNWLRGAVDWNVSRNRFWGTCIPIWVNESDPSDTICIGSKAELEELSGVEVTDLHKHVIDEIVIVRDGKTYRRTPEVLDCWFESGSMPYAQRHYPFEGGEHGEFFPAHFIAEGLDQTRGWFYTLLVLGTALFGKSPYRNVIVNGMVLASDGQKMSKSKRNFPDPSGVLEEYGADALRAYMVSSPVVRGEPLTFSDRGLKDVVRTVVLPVWNSLSFFTTYAVIDGFDPLTWQRPAVSERAEIDRWVLSVLQSLVRDVNEEMEAYRIYNVVPRLVEFVDDLTNWYVRRSRRRFWKAGAGEDKASAYFTLLEVLQTFSKLLAPFMPFLTEEVHQRLTRRVDADALASVHWCDYPVVDADVIDEDLERRMGVARACVALGRKLREEQRLKVRQPLARLTVVHRDEVVRADAEALSQLILEELNVKSMALEADEAAFSHVSVKPDFRELGKVFGPRMKEAAAIISAWTAADVAVLESGGTIQVLDEEVGLLGVQLQRDALEGAVVATDGELTIALDTEVTPELLAEGLAREFTSALQSARKSGGLDVVDRVRVEWEADDEVVRDAVRGHAEEIAAEVLAVSFSEGNGGDGEAVEIGGGVVRFRVSLEQA
jgi:isoleucyl-tRNA synthetase